MAAIEPPFVDFDFDFDVTPSAFPHQPSTEHFSPHHHRPDTPQLTLHDYHKFQQSPLLSASPDSDHRRVRRKPSVANLPAQAAFAWTSTSASPHFIHSFAHPSLLLSSLPPPPATPRPRPNTASPSLSSTVTTLQSTPTHTPVFRGGSHFEQRGLNERVELTEPIRTKRKFDSLKQARRLPRRAGGDSSSTSNERDGEIWEVYAAVFEPSSDYHGFQQEVEEVNRASDGHSWLQPAPLFAEQIATGRQRPRAVHFEETESTDEEGLAEDLTNRETRSREEKETTATSSYSLSKFQFPAPPGQDNWTGTFGHLTEPNSPSTPTTLHYHGTSFDLVNPHASLLLEGHNFETPAEIDGLLDDYFDTKTESDAMPYDKLTGEASQSSLRTGSDSSRHARVLYDDPDSARRHILHARDGLPTPPKAKVNDSHMANKNTNMPPFQRNQSAPLPARQTESKPTTNPFRGLPSIARVLGFGAVDERAHAQGQVAKIEGGFSREEAAFGEVKANLSPSASTQLKSQPGSLRRATHCSDPFDLTISESGSHGNLLSLEQAAKNEQRAENAPIMLEPGAVDASSPGAGAVSQVTYADQESDPTIKEIIGSYDYTRVPTSPEKDDPANSSPSVEYGRGITVNKDKQPMPRAHLPPAVHLRTPARESSANTIVPGKDQVKTPDSAVGLISQFPTPPTPVYGGYHTYAGCTELRTSDQTYGETNQLLQITPEANQANNSQSVNPPYPPPSTNPFRRNWHGGPSNAYPDPTAMRVSSTATVVRSNRDSDVPPEFRFYDTEEEEKDFHRPLPRNSSIYPFDPVYDDSAAGDDKTGDHALDDNESAWETEIASSAILPSNFGGGSYADTSHLGSENRMSWIDLQDKGPIPRTRPSQREKFEPPPPDAPADADDHRRDVLKAISLLSDNIVVEAMRSKNGSCPDLDKEQRRLDFEELERLRIKNPAAVREASEYLANCSMEKVQNVRTRLRALFGKSKSKSPRPDYKPESIFKKAKSLGLGQSSVRSGSDTHLLLSKHKAGDLIFDESEGDYVTVRSGVSPGVWSPFNQNTTEQALARPSPPMSLPSPQVSQPSLPGTLDIIGAGRLTPELNRPSKKALGKRPMRGAVGGQVELHELRLLRSNRNNPRRGRGLTDAELAQREPGWSLQPKRFASSPLTQSTSANQLGVMQPSPSPDVEVESGRVRPRLNAENLQARANVEKKEEISRNYAVLCLLVPFASLAYACGAFDGVMRKKTNGHVRGMTEYYKRWALYVHFPLCIVFYTIVILVILIVVFTMQREDVGQDTGIIAPPDLIDGLATTFTSDG